MGKKYKLQFKHRWEKRWITQSVHSSNDKAEEMLKKEKTIYDPIRKKKAVKGWKRGLPQSKQFYWQAKWRII